jgi:hypothetical protein
MIYKYSSLEPHETASSMKKRTRKREEQSDEDSDSIDLLEELDDNAQRRPITEKQFYKDMQKIKDRGNKAVPPKKSASAYIIFGKEKREEIMRRDPLSKVTAVVKEIAACWGLMTKEEKQKYKEAAKKGASSKIIIILCRQRAL